MVRIFDITNESKPVGVSTWTVPEDSGNFCSAGGRFGTHSTNESFYAPFYGKLLVIANFDGGVRVWDIRDPYHPHDVAFFIPNVTPNTIPTNVTINGVVQSLLDVSSDNAEVDDRGLIYIVDRVGGGADILQLTGEAREIVEGDHDHDHGH